MSRTRRSFSASEKLSIINEADQFGVTQTLRKHNLSHSVFKRWKESFNEGGVSNLQSYSKPRNPELDAIMEGDLTELLDSLHREYQADQLAMLAQENGG